MKNFKHIAVVLLLMVFASSMAFAPPNQIEKVKSEMTDTKFNTTNVDYNFTAIESTNYKIEIFSQTAPARFLQSDMSTALPHIDPGWQSIKYIYFYTLPKNSINLLYLHVDPGRMDQRTPQVIN